MSLEIKRVKVELMRVSAARADIELRIDEQLLEIERLKNHMKIQIEKEQELAEKIKSMEEKLNV